MKKKNYETEIPGITPTTPITHSPSMVCLLQLQQLLWSTSFQIRKRLPHVYPTSDISVSATQSLAQQSFLSSQPPFTKKAGSLLVLPFTKKAGSLLVLDENDHPGEVFEAIFRSNTFNLIITQTVCQPIQFNLGRDKQGRYKGILLTGVV